MMDSNQKTAKEPPRTLDERVTACHTQLSNKQKRLARFVLDNKYLISFASASQAGEKTGTSAATVVRFAQAIGYQGYSEMQAAIRAELPSYMSAIERIQDRLQAPLASDDVLQKVFHTDISNIERTANGLSKNMLSDAMDAIVQADHIYVIGAGLSAGPAQMLAHSLKIIGLDVRINQNEGLLLASDTAVYQPGDVMIAVGMWRYARSTLNAVKTARQMGVQVITITDSAVSPLSRVADYAFEVFTDSVSYSHSMTAVISLMNLMIAELSSRVPEQMVQALRRVDRAYLENNLLALE